jgi:hypothetical protein
MRNLSKLKLTAVLVTGVIALAFATIAVGQQPIGPPGPKAMVTPDGPMDPVKIQQTEAFHAEQMAKSRAAYVEWITRFSASNVDPRTLPLVEVNATDRPPPPTLDAAANGANLIVSGVATGVSFIPGHTIVTFDVQDMAKGPSPEPTQLTVVYPFGPNRDARDPTKAVFEYVPSSRPLFVGERAILLLEDTSNRQLPDALPRTRPYFIPQAHSGTMRLNAAGQVELPESVPFGAQLRGRPAQDVLAQLRR